MRFPGVPAAAGTVDLVMRNDTHVLHVDWKFGAGVGVRAVYEDDIGAMVNAQLMFYAAAALDNNRSWYTRRKLAVAIIQPRGDEPLSHTTLSRKEIKTFVEDVHAAVAAALDQEPPLHRGEHCRFAPCKVVCPLWTGPLLDLSALKPVVRLDDQVELRSGDATAYGKYLAHIKTLLDSAALLKKTVDEQLHSYLTDGGQVPGWRLKAKSKMRQWVDEETVRIALSHLGFKTSDIFQTKLQTFQHVDAVAKQMKVTVPDHLRVAPPTNETTIAPTDDPAPVVNPAPLMEAFRQSLLELKKEPQWLTTGNRSADNERE